MVSACDTKYGSHGWCGLDSGRRGRGGGGRVLQLSSLKFKEEAEKCLSTSAGGHKQELLDKPRWPPATPAAP